MKCPQCHHSIGNNSGLLKAHIEERHKTYREGVADGYALAMADAVKGEGKFMTPGPGDPPGRYVIIIGTAAMVAYRQDWIEPESGEATDDDGELPFGHPGRDFDDSPPGYLTPAG